MNLNNQGTMHIYENYDASAQAMVWQLESTYHLGLAVSTMKGNKRVLDYIVSKVDCNFENHSRFLINVMPHS